MKTMVSADNIISVGGGITGGFLTYLFGPWSPAMRVVLLLMLADFLSGLIIGITGRSPKSQNGALSSRVCWIGLMHKTGILLAIFVAAQLEYVTGVAGIRDGVVYAFCISEAISILENSSTLVVKIPKHLLRLVQKLDDDIDEEEDK